jgi:predicted ferric reductase
MRRTGAILDLRFRPTGRQMDFFPGQFVYMVVRRDGITDEPHPYSIANGYNLDGEIRLGIRQGGDHTRSLDRLRVGDVVSFYGPYGHFGDLFCEALRDCVFVGGGIGITPFIGMWHVALHSEDRYDASVVPEPIREMHPEILRSWQSPLVSLFYVCRSAEEAVLDTAIRNEVILSRFHGFSELEHRGHRYEQYDTSTQGRITASYLDANVRGGIRDKFVFLCGPTPMVDALIGQMTAMGMVRGQIIVEDFNLV